MTKKYKKIVLAYSGGLDTSVILPWLKEKYGCEVVAYAAELGQGSELKGVEDKALKSGASKCIVADLREEFVTDYIFPMLKAGAIYEDGYLLGTSIARPLIAEKMVKAALAEGADALAHGATGKGNDQVRFELTFMALAPELAIIAPWKDPSFELTSREAAIDYAVAHNIPIDQTKEKIYSRDRNLLHISHEGAELEEPWNEPKPGVLVMSSPIEQAPDTPEYVEIGFEQGIPVSLNGKKTGPVEIMEQLNAIGGKHGVGQIDIVENRLVGMKSRGVYETPGGTILYRAHTALETLTLDRETYHYKQQVSLKYAQLVYNGQWFTALRSSLDAFVNSTQQVVSGDVRLKLYKGNCVPAGVKSPYSLYDTSLASFHMDGYDVTDATGFIRLFGLPMRVEGVRRKKTGK
ncbi:MAG: argininosuccinate synthase [Sedimentisphaerales bacterium]|nr:argininosuccinate synthase [Sedimentisphaerales bacterium]